MFSFGFGALLVLIILLVWSFRILREYERGVVFNLGRYWAVKGPGWFILIPVIQQMVKMDLRTVVLDVPPQDVISRDNVSVKVNAVVYFRVVDPQKAVIQVADFLNATSQLAQMLSKQAEAMQLRYLQTLSNIAGDKTSTIVFPVPMDLVAPMLEAMRKRNP